MISHKVGVRVEPRFYHLFYISEPETGHPLIVGDAAVNVSPSIETRQAILHHMDRLARATGITRPKIAISFCHRKRNQNGALFNRSCRTYEMGFEEYPDK